MRYSIKQLLALLVALMLLIPAGLPEVAQENDAAESALEYMETEYEVVEADDWTSAGEIEGYLSVPDAGENSSADAEAPVVETPVEAEDAAAPATDAAENESDPQDPAPEETSALSARALTLGAGETAQLLVNGEKVARGSGYAFSSTDAAIAAVNADTGKITAKNAGTATVTVTGNGVTDSCEVTVKKAPTRVRLNVGKRTLGVGETYALVATLPANSASVLRYSSSRKSVATVSADGVITAKKTGTATVTVKTFNGMTATCAVTVKPAPTSISFGRTEITLGEGEEVPMTAKLNAGSAWHIAYDMADGAIAQINGGNLQGLRAGSETDLVATANGLTATLHINVVEAPEEVTLPESLIYMGLGEKRTLKPSVNDGSASAFRFKSSKKTVAKVNSSTGKITAKKKGKAVITVTTYNDKTAKCTVKVVNAPTKVTLSAKKLTLGAGEEAVLKASLPKGTASAIRFTSSNTAVVGVDANGVVSALAPGTATVTAKAFNGVKATCKVTVKAEPTWVEVVCPTEIKNRESVTLSARMNDGAVGAVTFEAYPEDVVQLDGNRLVAKSKGTATIVATAYNGVTSEPFQVTVVPNPRYRALLIGERNITGYSETPRNEADVQLMKTMLQSVSGPAGGKYSGNITTRINLSSSGVSSAINTAFAGADEDDVSLFFIATHGDSTSSGANAGRLVMTGGNADMLKMPTLAGWLADVPGKVVVIVEACGSGAAVKDYKTAYSNDAEAPSEEEIQAEAARFTEAVVEAFADADPGIVVSAELADGSKLARANGPAFVVENKFYVLTASDYHEDSYGLTAYNYFTKWLTDGVGTSGSMKADYYYGDGDGTVALGELYSYISEVGDNYPIRYRKGSGEIAIGYQHVQVYPANSGYGLFKR